MAGTEPELLLRRLLAGLARCDESDPIVTQAVAQIASVAAHGHGEVTLTFADHRLMAVTPASDWRFDTLQPTRR